MCDVFILASLVSVVAAWLTETLPSVMVSCTQTHSNTNTLTLNVVVVDVIGVVLHVNNFSFLFDCRPVYRLLSGT